MKKENLITISGAIVLLLGFIVLGVLSAPGYDVLAHNNSTFVKVRVWNTESNITNVTITPVSINLNPFSIKIVNCTATAYDYNGWKDINISNATFYLQSVGSSAKNNNTNHYTVQNIADNCTCAQQGSSPRNATCGCLFGVWYYATSGTWECNITLRDMGGAATNGTDEERFVNVSSLAVATINELIGIDAEDEVDYGNLSVTQTSDEKTINLSNGGNVQINVSVRGYGGTTNRNNPNNSSLNCDLRTIDLDYHRYSKTTGTSWDSMTGLTNDTTSIDMSLYVRADDTEPVLGQDRNQTFWRLKIPLSVGGYCNGTVEFFAEKSSP